MSVDVDLVTRETASPASVSNVLLCLKFDNKFPLLQMILCRLCSAGFRKEILEDYIIEEQFSDRILGNVLDCLSDTFLNFISLCLF